MPNFISEDDIEQAVLQKLHQQQAGFSTPQLHRFKVFPSDD
jgi:hypothetical protein